MTRFKDMNQDQAIRKLAGDLRTLKKGNGIAFVKLFENVGPIPVETPVARRRRQEAEQRKAREADIGDKNLNGLVLPEQQKHAEYVAKVNHVGKRRAQNTTECNLDIYLKRGILDGDKEIPSGYSREARQIEQENKMIAISRHSAAIHLYKDFYASRMVGGFKSCLNVTIGGPGGVNKAGLNFQAYAAYLAAIESIRGKRAQKLVVNVCCIGEWLKDCNSVGIPRHTRKTVFLRALDSLVDHYDRQINPSKIMASFNASITTTNGDPARV